MSSSVLSFFVRSILLEAQKDVKPLSKINQRALNKGKEVLFSDETLGLIANLPETELSRLENRKGFIKWLANVVEGASRHPSTQDIRYIVDFVVGSADARIEVYKTFDDAYKASQEWHETLSQGMDQDVEHRDDAQVIHDFKNGYKIVDLQQCDLDAEGNAMGHCVGTYDLSQGKKIYSLRDARNKPHVTIEIENGVVEQIKGKQNKSPVEKYAKMIRSWLNTTSLDYMMSADYLNLLNIKEFKHVISTLQIDKLIEFADEFNSIMFGVAGGGDAKQHNMFNLILQRIYNKLKVSLDGSEHISVIKHAIFALFEYNDLYYEKVHKLLLNPDVAASSSVIADLYNTYYNEDSSGLY